MPRGFGPVRSLRSETDSEELILTIWIHALPGAFNFEYKARERIHRSIADLRLLAIPASWGRVADPNPN